MALVRELGSQEIQMEYLSINQTMYEFDRKVSNLIFYLEVKGTALNALWIEENKRYAELQGKSILTKFSSTKLLILSLSETSRVLMKSFTGMTEMKTPRDGTRPPHPSTMSQSFPRQMEGKKSKVKQLMPM